MNYPTSSLSVGNGGIRQQSTNRILLNKSKGVTLDGHSHLSHQLDVNGSKFEQKSKLYLVYFICLFVSIMVLYSNYYRQWIFGGCWIFIVYIMN